ncbi:MDR family oxidoreductase [Burkholderia sp. L27(2015)]|uniref:acrylyl-CoA reductase (NADPH) n=1 Tax=Burkholderia sp. L27(2015) TaxID=1641858 RepID=UPI00131C5DB1|nr:MDR family oxidoreductase [Burkholderia sp. L27(2015)]
MTFSALYLQKDEHSFSADVTELDDQTLDENSLATGEVLVRIAHSTLNYKDALAITNRGPVVRGWPMVAGVDGAGEVIASTDSRWSVGDTVLVNGWGLGETHWGCLAEKARLKADWLIAVPREFSTAETMAIGTAGYTAMLSCLAVETAGVKPGDGEILVTGASGGVGSVAVSILSSWGYTVVASTGKPEQAEFLKRLGAASIVDRESISAPGKPLQKERWAAVIDSVGSHTLANACAQMKYGGVVTACGLAQGMDFPASVAPFILRGVRLLGIDSVMCPIERRQAAWDRLASDLDRGKLAELTRVIALRDVPAAAAQLMAGKLSGRTVVDIRLGT